MIALEDGERLRQAIAELPPPLMETLVMRDANGLSYRDLAEATGAPIGAKGARPGEGTETIDGYHVARWSDPNLAYIAVSDMDEKTLVDFVTAFRQAQKPASERPAP